MDIVIDDLETIRLLHEMMELTGETMEEAVFISVEQKLQLLRDEKTSGQLAAEDWARVLAHRRRISEAATEPAETSRTNEVADEPPAEATE
ncbi:MAG: type II toxin-antitoxin system VapB family antitoxin [Chloroflexia bacterium]|nr:type II toxin-antitoxin system VapB family antitoxin [Chloroflexia bacterium]MDQ3412462.1 type II toxin-antitoxin system VapB family antitoxin [Chloroflexota bacterium]